MYQGIKKEDSVTSILLFIFNVFLTEQEIKEIPLKAILKVLAPFQKSETAIRMGLSRGVQKGLLTNFKKDNEAYYGLTDNAIDSFKDWWHTIQKFNEGIKLQKSPWDETLNILSVQSKLPNEFILSLKQVGYGNLNKDLWISPNDRSESIIDLAKKYRVKIYLFQSKLINKEITNTLMNDIWPINALSTDYNLYYKDLTETVNDLTYDSLKEGNGLPILHLFGIKLMGLMQEDPQLPLQLLPNNWMGLKAAKKFYNIRKQILPPSKEFIDKVLLPYS